METILRHLLHYSGHFLLPLGIAYLVFRGGRFGLSFRRAVLLLWGTMLIDLDHLIADPIFDPNRCSVGFHPLHSEVAFAVYLLLLVPHHVALRLIASGCLWHLVVDSLDCWAMGTWPF